MKFVVIGGDAAGMSAASRAKRSRPEIDITVIEKTMDVCCQSCQTQPAGNRHHGYRKNHGRFVQRLRPALQSGGAG